MRKFGTLSLILGIIGLITSIFLVGLFPCIAALVLGILYIIKIKKSFGKSIAGISCAVIGIFISLLMFIALLSPISATDDNINNSNNTTISESTSSSSEKQTEKQTETPTEKQTQKQTEAPTEKQTERQTEVSTEKQTEKQTEAPTEKQTEKQTETSTEKQTEIQQQPSQSSPIMVWIVDNGSRYHCDSSCSNMRAPYQVTIETAKNKGLTACKRCY